MLGDEEDFPLREPHVRFEERGRRRERECGDASELACDQLALCEQDELRVKGLVQLDVGQYGLGRGVVDRLLEAARRLPKIAQLGRRLEPLGCETRGRALEDAAELDRVVDLRTRELA